MQRVICSTFLVGAFALAGLTACGDKVNVVGVNNDTTVTSVTVTPSSPTLNVGDKITLVATVTGGAGLTNRNVTWSSGNAAVATVDANGVVTAVGGGTTSIIAASAQNPAVKGAASVTVGAVVQPTVTVASITQNNVTAQLGNIANQLDVTVNVDAGTQKLSKVDLLVNCGGADTVVATQTIASGDVAPIDAEASASTVQMSFNTAAFNATSGVVAFKNGACTLKARATTTSGTIVASNGTPFTLNNIDGVIVVTTNSGATAGDAKGAPWKSGSVTVSATPVIYSGRTPATITITLPGAITASQTLTAAATGATSATWGTGTSGPRVTGKTLFGPAGLGLAGATPPGGQGPGVDANGIAVPVHPTVLLIDSNGNDLNLTQLSPTSQSDIRVDNEAPVITGADLPVINLTVQNAQNGWVGKNFTFGFNATGAPITLTANTVADSGGVDKITVATQSSPSGAGTWTTFTSPTSLAETSSSTAYDLRIVICDALNNCSTSVSPFTKFGVDLTPPSLALVSGVTNNKTYGIGATVPSTIVYGFSDTSNTVGVSGSGPGATSILVSVQGLQPDSSSATGSRTRCPVGVTTGSGLAVTCKSQVASASTFTLPNTVNGINAQSDGQYVMVANAVDQAGNTSAALTTNWYNDHDAPAVTGGVSIPNPINASSTFSLSASDSMDIVAGNGFLSYPSNNFFETGTASPVGAAFDNALTRSSTISTGLTVFYRSLAVAAGGVVPGTAGALPTTLGVRAIDAAGNLSVNQPVTLPAANIGTPVAISNSSATNGITKFAIDSVKPNPVDATKSVTFYVGATAFAATGGNPLSQVCFYFSAPGGAEGGAADASGAAAGELVKIGCTSSSATTGDGVTNRFFQYQFVWTPPARFYGSSATVFAVGNTAAFDALIAPSVVVNVNALP